MKHVISFLRLTLFIVVILLIGQIRWSGRSVGQQVQNELMSFWDWSIKKIVQAANNIKPKVAMMKPQKVVAARTTRSADDDDSFDDEKVTNSDKQSLIKMLEP
jgi:hypothetical protein